MLDQAKHKQFKSMLYTFSGKHLKLFDKLQVINLLNTISHGISEYKWYTAD